MLAAFMPYASNGSGRDQELKLGVGRLRRVPVEALEECPLGERAIKLADALHEDGFPIGIDLLGPGFQWPFTSVICSGWPVFGLASTFIFTHFGVLERSTGHSLACSRLSDAAMARFPAESMMIPTNFVELILDHLKLRPSRRHLPVPEARRFRAFARRQRGDRCVQAIVTAELVIALASLQPPPRELGDGAGPSNRSVAALRLVARAEGLLRRFDQQFSLDLEWQYRFFFIWPITDLLQGIQDAFFSAGGLKRVGVGADRWADEAAALLRAGPGDWEQRRQMLREAVFGPSGQPSAAGPTAMPLARGADAGQATGGSGCGGEETSLTWDLGKSRSTAVLCKLAAGAARGLVLLHHGHEGFVYSLDTVAGRDFYGLVALFSSMGFDTITLQMPDIGWNALAAHDGTAASQSEGWRHQRMQRLYVGGDFHVLRFYLAPAMLAMDWAGANLGHEHAAMVGFSGGAWTTQVLAALDVRISLSIAVAGPIPPAFVDYLEWERYDFELQYYPTFVYERCPKLCMSVLATIGWQRSRRSVHLFHLEEGDPPRPCPDCARGIVRGLTSYYEEHLPKFLAAAAGHAGVPAPHGAPLRLALTEAVRHIGDWRDTALLEEVLGKWALAHVSGNGSRDPLADWPPAVDARRRSDRGDAEILV